MHPHLHTKDNIACEEIMTALDECHARGFLVKATGGCNEIKQEVTKCLRALRIERSKRNREQALANRKEMKRMFKDIEENS
ncbi:cytochrome c oxidase biogenesis protein Cmc1-like protein [Kalaharituber pfeilii]|nr:cytochrome c oxidase biogenesis protein Cmc1-like protein [Kalaharituber pfeilii]